MVDQTWTSGALAGIAVGAILVITELTIRRRAAAIAE
jgi:hypothetical protein